MSPIGSPQQRDGEVAHQGPGAEQAQDCGEGRAILIDRARGNPLRATPYAASPRNQDGHGRARREQQLREDVKTSEYVHLSQAGP